MPAAALAADIPVAGALLRLRASRSGRSATLVLRDGAVAAPLPDPSRGAALIVNGGAGPGQCRAEIALDPGRWRALGGDGARRGYRYDAPAPGTAGVRRIVLRPGALAVRARGASWPCDLAARTERLPLSVVLRVAETRYCAAFPRAHPNRRRHLEARRAAAPATCPDTDLTVANLNLLHGILCPAATANCRFAERVDLLFLWIAARGCPDVVMLEEVTSQAVDVIGQHLAGACPFTYQAIYQRGNGIDDELILSRYPAVAAEFHGLFGGFRNALFARLDHPLGPLDVLATHLGSTEGSGLCGPACPPECVAGGASTGRECQAVQLAALAASRHDVPTPAVIAGDFNEDPGTFAYGQFASRGWIDTYLAAGNPECDPATGIGCTSGRADEDLSALESPANGETERINYIFLVPPGPGSLCRATIDSSADADADGTGTRLFADQPNPFTPGCGPAPAALCWPSDHMGVQLDLGCG